MNARVLQGRVGRTLGWGLALALVGLVVPSTGSLLPARPRNPPPTGAEVTLIGFEVDPAALDNAAPSLLDSLELPAPESEGDTPATQESTPAPESSPSPTASTTDLTVEQTVAVHSDEMPSGQTVLTARGDASGYTVVGVTWALGTDPAQTSVALRSATGGQWSQWEEVPISTDRKDAGQGSPSDAGIRGGTDPIAVGRVDEVEVALTGTADGDLPSDPQLVIIDPDAHPNGATTVDSASAGPGHVSDGVWRTGDASVRTVAAHASSRSRAVSVADEARAGAPAPKAPPLGTAISAPRPQIYSRAQWGADESMMTWKPQVGTITGAFIHHTVNSNTYSAAEVPSMIRGIYTFHAESRGWGDIGYNVLVDAYGRAWEGRAGGLDRATIGAHTSGYNATNFGLSVIGNFETGTPPRAVIDTVASVIAWKLGANGVRAGASTIRGHRDVGQTSCPGTNLYARLGDIRTKAAAVQGTPVPPPAPPPAPAPVTSAPYVHDATGDGFADLVVNTGSALGITTRYARGWGGRELVGSGWVARDTIAPGDFQGDGLPDLLLRVGATMYFYAGTPAGGWQPPTVVSMPDLAAMNLITGGFDWTGDGRTDLLARRGSDGSLWLYPGTGTGGVQAPRQIGSHWSAMTAIQMIGHLADGKPALVARSSTGTLYTYRGDGTGGFAGQSVVGPGWNAMTTLVGVGDMGTDGNVDLVAVDGTGAMWLYTGNGSGRFALSERIGAGWTIFSTVLAAGGPGPGETLFGVSASGDLWRYRYSGEQPFDDETAVPIPMTDVVETILPGDWNGDGQPDLITRRSDGVLLLYTGNGAGGFAGTGRPIGNGWNIFTQVIGAGDWLGTGVATLVALDRSTGRLVLYPGDGAGGFRTPVVLATDASGVDRVVMAGRWSGGKRLDLLTRSAATGVLQLRRGTATGGLDAPVAVGIGWNGLRMVGAGDVDWDGHPDLVAAAGTQLLLYRGNGAGGFGAVSVIGDVPVGAALS